MTKTVADAVKYHGGEWPSLSYGKNWIVYSNSDGFDNWSMWDDSDLNPTWQRVCNREQFEQHASRKPYDFDHHVSVNVEYMQGDVKEFYKDGQRAREGEKNPYCRNSQVRAFYSWSAGYCDKHGTLPKES